MAEPVLEWLTETLIHEFIIESRSLQCYEMLGTENKEMSKTNALNSKHLLWTEVVHMYIRNYNKEEKNTGYTSCHAMCQESTDKRVSA